MTLLICIWRCFILYFLILFLHFLLISLSLAHTPAHNGMGCVETWKMLEGGRWIGKADEAVMYSTRNEMREFNLIIIPNTKYVHCTGHANLTRSLSHCGRLLGSCCRGWRDWRILSNFSLPPIPSETHKASPPKASSFQSHWHAVLQHKRLYIWIIFKNVVYKYLK